MRKSALGGAAVLVALALALTACSGKKAASPGAAPAQQSQQSGATVATAHGTLGTILVDGAGRTLYAFTKDASGQSNCNGECAATWPPLLAQGTPASGDGVTASLLGTLQRSDGKTQAAYANHPLYYYGGDSKPGDANGQGLNGVWFTLGADGSLVGSGAKASGSQPAGGAVTIRLASTPLGQVLTDTAGRTLYAFKKDSSGQSTCDGACAQTWPALTASGNPTGGSGTDASLLGVTPRANGTVQVTYHDWPLYYYAGDSKPGDTNGQGINSVWYVLGANGKLVTTAAAGGGSSGGGYGYGYGG